MQFYRGGIEKSIDFLVFHCEKIMLFMATFFAPAMLEYKY